MGAGPGTGEMGWRGLLRKGALWGGAGFAVNLGVGLLILDGLAQAAGFALLGMALGGSMAAMESRVAHRSAPPQERPSRRRRRRPG